MFNYLLYRIGQTLASLAPLKLGYKIASLISDLNYTFNIKDRRSVRENLKVIFPQKTEQEIRGIEIRMFRNFSKYLVDFFRFNKINSGYIKKNIKIENIRYFDEARKNNKGVIILTAHLGNWELGGVVIALSGYPFWVVALPHKNKLVDKFFNSQRQSKGVKSIPVGRAVRKSLDILKNNECLALVGDRDFTEQGTVIDFFGKPAIFPVGAAALSIKTGAKIVPGFMIRNPDDSFTLRIEKPLEFTLSGNKEKDTLDIINSYKLIFEDYIRKYPDQWYVFRKFYKS